MAMAFDTHEAAKEYGRAGFTEAQVEALVNVARRTAILPEISHLATKSDIAGMATKSDNAGMIRFMNPSNNGTAKAVSPWAGL
jgi:hypothetical protein